jgi:lysophospholipid acyltransferase (LPLAT)-like uncharacterized protein
MAYAASRAWFFGWDRFVLPWPFSRIAIAIGKPVEVEKSVALNQREVMTAWQQRMERELHELFETAQEALS